MDSIKTETFVAPVGLMRALAAYLDASMLPHAEVKGFLAGLALVRPVPVELKDLGLTEVTTESHLTVVESDNG